MECLDFRAALAELQPDHREALMLMGGCGLHRAAFPVPRRKRSICTMSDHYRPVNNLANSVVYNLLPIGICILI
jgi:hypothetical protein